ncbi:tetratricopeptide repeat protein, partial [Chitinimonas sp.]|uniref:tetratricopeptide repeat protein n=1 Tax=Chitinimonas sp. TaxID=1934313 RepID=UPI0035B4CF0A
MSDSALTHETAGTTDEAIAAMMPRLEAAIAVSVAGKLEEADQQLRLLLSEQPDNLYILNALGSNSARLGKISEAAHFLELVVSRDPKNAGAHNNLGNLHKIAGNRDAAIASYSRSIELQPGYAEAHYNLGISLAEAGRRDEAIESYERALMFNPAYPEAHNNLATLMLERGDFEQATTHFRQALIWNPDLPQATLNLAFSLTRLGEFAESNEIYQGLLAANPRDIDVQKSFAVALAQQGRHEEALAMLEQVVADQPDSADAWANLGSIYHMSRRFEDAVRCFDETLRLRPLGTSPVHQLIGNSLLEQGAVDESLERFQHAAMLNPQAATANGNYANTLRATGRIAEAVKSLKKCAEAAPDNAELLSNLIYTLHFDPQRTPAERFEAARLWAKRFENTETEAVPHIIATEQRDRPIRVGLVSGDLRDHSVAYFLRPLLENHERGQISLFAYNTSLAPLDAVSHRFKEQVEHWREIGALSDPVAIDMIRRDSVDILIDLSVHT